MTTIKLIEWLEGSIASDKECFAEEDAELPRFGYSCYIIQAEMTLDHIRALPSRPSDAELIGWGLKNTALNVSHMNRPRIVKDRYGEYWGIEYRGVHYGISDKTLSSLDANARAILEPEWRKANP